METSLKRMLSLLVALVMVLSLIPASPIHVHAAEGEETTDTTRDVPTPTLETTVAMIGDAEYATLADAFAAAKSGKETTIDLVRDTTITAQVSADNGKIVLNLNDSDFIIQGNGQIRSFYVQTNLTVNGGGEGKIIIDDPTTASFAFSRSSTNVFNNVTIEEISESSNANFMTLGTMAYTHSTTGAATVDLDCNVTFNDCDLSFVGVKNGARRYLFYGGNDKISTYTSTKDPNSTVTYSNSQVQVNFNGGSLKLKNTDYVNTTASSRETVFYGLELFAEDLTVDVSYIYRLMTHTGGELTDCTINVSNATNTVVYNAEYNTNLANGKLPLKLKGNTAITGTSAPGATHNANLVLLYDNAAITNDGKAVTPVTEYFAHYDGEYYTSVQEAVDAAAANGGTVVVSRPNAEAVSLPVGVSLKVNSGISYTGTVTTDNVMYAVEFNEETNTYTVKRNDNIALTIWNGSTLVSAYETFDLLTIKNMTAGHTARLEKDYTVFKAANDSTNTSFYKELTVDLNGHTLTLSGNAVISAMSDADVTIKNGTLLDNLYGATNVYSLSAVANGLHFENVKFTNIGADGKGWNANNGTYGYDEVNEGRAEDKQVTPGTGTLFVTPTGGELRITLKNCVIDYKDTIHAYVFNGGSTSAACYGGIDVENVSVTIDNTDYYAQYEDYRCQVLYAIDVDGTDFSVHTKYVDRLTTRLSGTLVDSSLIAENNKDAYYLIPGTGSWIQKSLHMTGAGQLSYNGGGNGSITATLIEVDPTITRSSNLDGKVTVHYADHAGTHYTTVQAAIDAAAEAYATSGVTETVTLLGNADETVVVPAGVSVDKNGYTITGISCAAGCAFTAVDNGDGTHTKTCDRCGSEITEEHTYGEGAYTDPVEGVKDGYWTYTCTADGCNHTNVTVDKDSATPAGKVSYTVDAEGNRTYHETVASAAAALTAGQTLTLVTNVTEPSVMVMAGTALDLNGYTLTVDAFAAFGEITGDGVLKVTNSSNITLPGQKTTLALWDAEAEGYRFVSNEHYNITDYAAMQGSGENSYLMFWAQIEDGSVLDTLMANGFADNGLKLVVHLEYSIEVGGSKLPLSVDVNYEPLLDDLASANGSTLTLSLGNAVDFPDLTYTIKFVSDAGYEIVGASGAWFPAA